MREQIHDDLGDVLGRELPVARYPASPRPLNPVDTEPGRTMLTRMPSWRTSCISASLNALSAAFDAQ